MEDPATLVRLADASGIGGHALLAASDDAALATQEAAPTRDADRAAFCTACFDRRLAPRERWTTLRRGGACSEVVTGVIPHPEVNEPLWIEGMWAFLNAERRSSRNRPCLLRFRKWSKTK